MSDGSGAPTHDDWSVLTKSEGPERSAPPTEGQIGRMLSFLPGEDKWIQYPPASGRGHAFETRFWISAGDASAAAERGVALVLQAQHEIGLADWRIVRVHAASVPERELEYYPGLEARALDADDWSIMHRSIRPDHEAELQESERAALASVLGPRDCHVSVAGRLLEVRFWVPAEDAVAAAAEADHRVRGALASLGRSGWTSIRLQSASAAERRRELYLGVERRLEAAHAT